MENNKLIAEFLGWENLNVTCLNVGEDTFIIDSNLVVDKSYFNLELKDGTNVCMMCVDYLKFSSDWNWLMLVVEKINTIEGGRFTFQIMSMDVEIHDYLKGGLYIDFFSGNTPDQLIKSVYEACVEFVKKYNNENGK